MSDYKRFAKKIHANMKKGNFAKGMGHRPSLDAVTEDKQTHAIGPTTFQPPTKMHADLIASTKSPEKRAAVVRQLQQTYGNRYVQSLVETLAMDYDHVPAIEEQEREML